MHVNYGITLGLEIHKKLEQLQLEAVSIVTGLPIFTKTEMLYNFRQVGNYYLWDGRAVNFNFCYNIVNKNTPYYLCTLILPTIQSTSVYPLRNANNIILPFCGLSSTIDYFIPSTIKMWNSLDNNIRNLIKIQIRIKENRRNWKSFCPQNIFPMIFGN